MSLSIRLMLIPYIMIHAASPLTRQVLGCFQRLTAWLRRDMQGMPIDSSVAELITAQLWILVQEAPDPIYFYINSTGIAVSA